MTLSGRIINNAREMDEASSSPDVLHCIHSVIFIVHYLFPPNRIVIDRMLCSFDKDPGLVI